MYLLHSVSVISPSPVPLHRRKGILVATPYFTPRPCGQVHWVCQGHGWVSLGNTVVYLRPRILRMYRYCLKCDRDTRIQLHIPFHNITQKVQGSFNLFSDVSVKHQSTFFCTQLHKGNWTFSGMLSILWQVFNFNLKITPSIPCHWLGHFHPSRFDLLHVQRLGACKQTEAFRSLATTAVEGPLKLVASGGGRGAVFTYLIFSLFVVDNPTRTLCTLPYSATPFWHWSSRTNSLASPQKWTAIWGKCEERVVSTFFEKLSLIFKLRFRFFFLFVLLYLFLQKTLLKPLSFIIISIHAI